MKVLAMIITCAVGISGCHDSIPEQPAESVHWAPQCPYYYRAGGHWSWSKKRHAYVWRETAPTQKSTRHTLIGHWVRTERGKRYIATK